MFKFTVIFILFFICQIQAQSIESLRQNIEQIISSKDATVGVAILGTNKEDTLSINGDKRFPMQSVFKFHIGVVVLSEIDKGKYSLEQEVKIEKHELLPGLWSPIREKYPDGVTLTLAEILQFTISVSDNVGCDLLLRLLGGANNVEEYFHRAGFIDISIKINEEVMQNNWELQFQNWITPVTANEILKAVYNNKNLLSQSSYEFFWKTLKETSTGINRLKGNLPDGTVVAHKTGSSGTNKTTGITAAVNDIGIVFLPDGSYYIISVFVTDSKEDFTTNEKIIADIGKAAWDYFTNSSK
ncbi:MAG: class A beta-lactamase, subclass A2 [Ignavibacteriaceae bacterium]|nr:class A beta-lactamase, subclass A2 [Ignavibacteriaceae bacterium]